MSREFSRLLAPLARRIRLAAARAVVTLIDDATKLQGAQVRLLADEVRDRVERFQQYGITAVPLPGAEGIYLSLNGSRDQGVLICVDDRRCRPTGLEPGESALYDDQGQRVHITRTGIEIIGAGLPVTIKDTPKVRIESDLEVTGQVKDRCDADGRTMAGMRQTYNDHTHSDPQGGSVGGPSEEM